MRGLILAVQFLTRIPTPQIDDFQESEFSACAIWFPAVGLLLGALLVAAAMLGLHAHLWMAALLVLLFWVALTGGLHIDGAADLADALGAGHANPERFQAVMKDPHLGVFGVLTLVMICLTKLVAVAVLLQQETTHIWALLLIPAWARLGSMIWSQNLPPLAAGRGERFAWQLSQRQVWLWCLVLFIATVVLLSFVFALQACIVIALWYFYLKWRLGGMSGDCLGAGIEYSECAMLLALVLL